MPSTTNTMLKKSDLDRTFFVPMTCMQRIIDFVKSEKNVFLKKRLCDNNLYKMQRTRYNTFNYSLFGKQNWAIMFSMACRKALYSHDWDKLLYMLKKVPKWKFSESARFLVFDSIYLRYLTLLLMYHPSSQAQGLLCEYLHMSLGCRSDQDKKALLKVLLHLPKRLPHPWYIRKQNEVEDSD